MSRFRFTISGVVVLLMACAPVAEGIRAITYPPSFHYIPRSELRSTMWELASDIVELARMLNQPATIIVTEDVVAKLTLMQAHVAELAGKQTNHPRFEQHIARFQHDLSDAKLAAEATPPNYFLAGSLTGSCTSCHEDQRAVSSFRGTP